MFKLDYFRLMIQIIAAVISLFFLFKKKNKFILLLTILLFLSSIVESIGAYFLIIKKSSFYYSYVYVLLQFFIISFMYNYLIKEKKWEKLLFAFFIVYFLFWILVFFNKSMFPYLIIVGSLLISVYVLMYLRVLLLSNEILNYKRQLPFWVSVGFLVFYLPSIPFFSMHKYFEDRSIYYVINILVILMNSIISFGLIWSNKGMKY